MSRLALGLVTIAFVAIVRTAAVEAQNQNAPTVTGTWDVTFTLPAGSSVCPGGGPDCPLPALASATSDGTLIQTAAVPNISEGHGVWVRGGGPRTFLLKSKYFRYGAGGALVGSSEASTTVKLEKDGLSGSGTYEIRLLDLDGTLLGSFTGLAVFQRIVP